MYIRIFFCSIIIVPKSKASIGQTLIQSPSCCHHSGQVLLKNMLKPLVMYPSLSVNVTEREGEGTILSLNCLEESQEEHSSPSQVYCKLLLVLKTLHSHLLGTESHFKDAHYLHILQLGTWFSRWDFNLTKGKSHTSFDFQMFPSVTKSSQLSWRIWFGRKFPSASSTSVCSTPSPPTAANWINTALYDPDHENIPQTVDI